MDLAPRVWLDKSAVLSSPSGRTTVAGAVFSRFSSALFGCCCTCRLFVLFAACLPEGESGFCVMKVGCFCGIL